jgi:hypothetical protein
MSTFRTFGNDGIIELMDGEAHLLLVTVADFEGHKSVLKVPVLSRYPGSIVSVPMADPVGNAMDLTWNRENRIVYDELDLVIPQGALYEDITFIYSKSPRAGWSYSGLYSLHQPEVPLHKGLKVKLDAGQLPARLKSKACLVRVDDNGRRHYAGGSFKDGFVSGSPTVFGTYAIGVDTLKPVIKKIGDKSKKKSSIRFTVTDNFSGIGSYSGELNGQWVLVEFDPKNDLMIYRFDENLLSGKNQFKLTVTDNKGNKAAYSTTINGK